MENQELLDVKMLLESLCDIVNEMGGCTMKIDYRKPSRVARLLNDFDDIKDPMKVPVLVGELSVTGNPSLLVLYIGIYGFKIVVNHNDVPSKILLCSKDGESRGSLLSPFYFFRTQCISTSIYVSRNKICDAIKEKETILGNNKEKKEYDGNNDTAMLLKFKKELEEFDEKFSKYKK